MATQSTGASYHSITHHIREFLAKDRPTFNDGWEVIRLLDTLEPSERELAIQHIKSATSGLQVVMPNGDLPRDHWSNNTFQPLPGKLPGFTYMPPGTYMMGATPDVEEPEDEETPRCEVTITEGLDISNAPISRKDWYDVVVEPGYGVFPGSELCVGVAGEPVEPVVNGVVQYSDAYPIDNINWYESVKYCNLLSEYHGLEPVYSFEGEEGRMGEGYTFTDSSLVVSGTADGFRLLREAEWECMARAGCNKALYGPLDEVAWHNENSNGLGRSDGKLPNAWGFQDVLGNVWEWVFDAWRCNHPSEPITVLNNGFIPALDNRLGKPPSAETVHPEHPYSEEEPLVEWNTAAVRNHTNISIPGVQSASQMTGKQHQEYAHHAGDVGGKSQGVSVEDLGMSSTGLPSTTTVGAAEQLEATPEYAHAEGGGEGNWWALEPTEDQTYSTASSADATDESGHASTTVYGSESVSEGKQSEEDLGLTTQGTSSSPTDSTSSHTSVGTESESANEYKGGMVGVPGETSSSSGQVAQERTHFTSNSAPVPSNTDSPKSTTQREYAEEYKGPRSPGGSYTVGKSPSPSETGKSQHCQQGNMTSHCMGGATDADYAGGVGDGVGKPSEETPNTSTTQAGTPLTTQSHDCQSAAPATEGSAIRSTHAEFANVDYVDEDGSRWLGKSSSLSQPHVDDKSDSGGDGRLNPLGADVFPHDYAGAVGKGVNSYLAGKSSEGSPSPSTDAGTSHRAITTKKYHARAYVGFLSDYFGTCTYIQRSASGTHGQVYWHTLQERFIDESGNRDDVGIRICRRIL